MATGRHSQAKVLYLPHQAFHHIVGETAPIITMPTTNTTVVETQGAFEVQYILMSGED